MKELKFLPPPKTNTIPVSMTSTRTFSGVGFLKDMMTEEPWKMHALMLVGSIK